MKMTGPFWVYVHTTPDNMVYVGRSGRKTTEQRWSKHRYAGTSLYPYIEKYGMDNIEHFFIDGLSKEESYRLEGELIKMYKEKGVCINKRGSHGLCCGGDEHLYYEATKEHRRELNKKWAEEHKEKIKEMSHKYYETHKDKHKEAVKKWQSEHKDHIREKARLWWANNREECCRKQREYRRKKKNTTKKENGY